jgi:hypothetical protein
MFTPPWGSGKNPGEIDLKSEAPRSWRVRFMVKRTADLWPSWQFQSFQVDFTGDILDRSIQLFFGIGFDMCFMFFPQQFTRTSLKRCGFWYVSTAMFWWLVRGIPCWQKLKIIRCLFCLCLGKKNGMHLESHSIPAICKHNGTWPKHVPSTYRYNYAYDAWASLLKLKKYVVCSTLRDPGCSESPIWHISIWLFHAVSTGEPFLCEKYPHFGWWREITVFRIQNRSIWVDVFCDLPSGNLT